MKKYILLLFVAVFLGAEPSAFEAGDINNPNPYGLTPDEEHIYQNKIAIQKLQKIVTQQQQIIKEQQKQIKQLNMQVVQYKMNADAVSQKISGIETILPSFDQALSDVAILKKDINQTKSQLTEMEQNITTISKEVQANKISTDKSIQNLISIVEKLALSVSNIKKQKENADFRKYNNSRIFSMAVSELKHRKFNLAKEKFLYLYAKKYRLATILFYLGEVEYMKGNYKLALGYYKKSIKTSSKKAFYTPELLYHSGYAFERIGLKSAAKKSYQKIISSFPESIFVKYAKKRLYNLEKTK
jgi:TolA-binding protein